MLVEFTFPLAHVDVYILHMYNRICKCGDGETWNPFENPCGLVITERLCDKSINQQNPQQKSFHKCEVL